MSIPKKSKLTLDINPPKIGTEYLKYGFDRIEELMNLTDSKTKYLPRTILMEDLDQGLFDYVTNKLKVVIDGKLVNVFYLDNDRYGEYQKTWTLADDDKNVATPYITVRRTDKQPGTRLGTKFRVPQPRSFRYMDVPILDNGEIINLRFKMPEPINIDLSYEVALVTKYRVDVNEYDQLFFKNFSSKQDYIAIKGNPVPITFESLSEANTIENVDGDRFFLSKYTIKMMGFIQDENDFEIVKTTRRPKISTSI
jgi:hypothetical protein